MSLRQPWVRHMEGCGRLNNLRMPGGLRLSVVSSMCRATRCREPKTKLGGHQHQSKDRDRDLTVVSLSFNSPVLKTGNQVCLVLQPLHSSCVALFGCVQLVLQHKLNKRAFR